MASTSGLYKQASASNLSKRTHVEETEEDIVIKKPKKRVKKVVEYVDVSGESSGEEEDVTIEPSQNLSELHDIDVDDEEYSQVQEPYVPPEENVSSSDFDQRNF